MKISNLMKQRLTKQELVLVAGAAVLGFFLRADATDNLAVEHFDEGVYSSSVWYQQPEGAVYPSRHLYAPPALPLMIAAASRLANPGLAPFIPGLLAGAITIVIVWMLTRAAFGMVAGTVVVPLVAFSDFHILYSRMALTDVPALMWIVLAVSFGVRGIDRQCLWTMILAGIACGCAWWTKYTGWLPIAIVSSGSLLWWVIGGHRQCKLRRLLALNSTMALCACAIWSPWLWALQSVGGYDAVAANHDAYRTGWTLWSENLATQITWYSMTDSWLGALAIVLGVTCAGTHRWMEARGSTWNRSAAAGTGVTPALLARFVGAAVILSIAALTIGSFGVLAALGVGGIAGIFLWPSLPERAHGSAACSIEQDELSRRVNLDPTDVHASPSVDPRLAACIVTAWFCGLFLYLPTYTPFPRLLLPLLAVIWIAAAGGIGWWVEACLGVARRSAASGIQPQRSVLQLVLSILVLLSVSLALWTLDGNGVPRSSIHDTRTGLRDASVAVASMCRAAAGVETGGSQDAADGPRFIVYAFGEPAVLYHLNQAGVLGQPVQDVLFKAAVYRGRPLPTFLVFGPNALRTPGFMYDWVDLEQRFEHIGNVSYAPSDIVLYNLFSPQWILQHPGDERDQRLEVYRLR